MPRRLIALLVVGVFAALASAAPAGVARHRPQVLVVHGGGWTKTGDRMVRRMAADARRRQRLGYGVENIDYRPGRFAYPDVLAAYDRLRARVGEGTPICILGASAGGHMALMAALQRPDVACVIAHAPPTDITTLSADLQRRAHGAFDWLGGAAMYSPARYAFHTPLLLVQGTDDPIVPVADSRLMHAAAPGSALIELPPGTATFTHTRVDARALGAAHAAERRFLRRRLSGN